MVSCFRYMEKIRIWMESENAVFQPVTNNCSQKYFKKKPNGGPKSGDSATTQKCLKYRESSILLCPTNCYVNTVPTLAFRIHLFNFPLLTCCSSIILPSAQPFISRSFIVSLLLPCYFNFIRCLWCNKTLIY